MQYNRHNTIDAVHYETLLQTDWCQSFS